MSSDADKKVFWATKKMRDKILLAISPDISNKYRKSSNFQKVNKIADVLNYNKIFSRNGKKILINCIKKISKKKNSILRKKYLDNLGSKRIANYISQKLLT